MHPVSMSLDLWSRAKPIFEEVREQSPHEQDAFLTDACAGDQALREEVDRLIALDAESEGFFDRFGADLRAPGDSLPTRIGPWEVDELIGQGGMGRVLRAHRADGAYDQSVAIKIVESAAPVLVRRFQRERRILAGLDHPHVARLIDGGALPDGRPYLVMEHVEGQPLTAYCDARGLGVDARLALFLQVCDVIALAHRSLVVHRDLKPSNILVSEAEGDPTVKLLDFGIARLLDDADDRLTHTGQRLSTPGYAAPEQIRGGAITTATDIYGLGVLLFELLTGRRPFVAATRRDLEEAVLHADAPAASAVIVGPDAARQRRRLRGDLDRIVATSLRKEPEQRYGSAEALARDVRRHLGGLPIEARRPTLGYRTRRFVQRHRAGVTAAVAVVVAIGALGLVHVARVASERDVAEAQAARAERVSAFLTDLLNRGADSPVSTGLLLDLLGPSVARVDAELADAPEARAAVLFTLGRLYDRVGLREQADSLLRASLALRQTLHSPPHPDLAATLYALGHRFIGQPDSAVQYFREAASMQRALGADSDALAWSLLQWDRVLPRNHPEKGERYRQALAMFTRLHGPRSPEVAWGMQEYYAEGSAAGTVEDYETAFVESLEILQENGLDRDPEALNARYNLGLHYEREGRFDLAFPLFEETIRLGREVFPPGTSMLNTMMTNYGASLHEQGLYLRADSVLHTIAGTTRRALPAGAGPVGHSHYWYGRNLLALGRPREAERALRIALETYANRTPRPAQYGRIQIELGRALADQGRVTEAEILLRESAASLRGTAHEPLALERLVEFYESIGRREEAAPFRDRLRELA